MTSNKVANLVGVGNPRFTRFAGFVRSLGQSSDSLRTLHAVRDMLARGQGISHANSKRFGLVEFARVKIQVSEFSRLRVGSEFLKS